MRLAGQKTAERGMERSIRSKKEKERAQTIEFAVKK